MACPGAFLLHAIQRSTSLFAPTTTVMTSRNSTVDDCPIALAEYYL